MALVARASSHQGCCVTLIGRRARLGTKVEGDALKHSANPRMREHSLRHARRPRPWQFVLMSVAILAAVACTVSTARATPRTALPGEKSIRSVSPFCQDAVVFGKHGTNLLKLPPATLKADYAQFKTLAAKMVPLAPTSIRTDLKAIFTFDLGIFKELSKVGWSFAKIPRTVLEKWAIQGPKLKPASDKVITYIDAKCGLKLRKP